jgi:hypothetical protein
MATLFADIYAVVELPDRSQASWIKKTIFRIWFQE